MLIRVWVVLFPTFYKVSPCIRGVLLYSRGRFVRVKELRSAPFLLGDWIQVVRWYMKGIFKASPGEGLVS